MSVATESPTPSKTWIILRISMAAVMVWMGSAAYGLGNQYSSWARLSESRAVQAAILSHLPLSTQEERLRGRQPLLLPTPTSDDRPDQVVAASTLSMFWSNRASDVLTGTIATATAAVGSLVIALNGIRDLRRRRRLVRAVRDADRGHAS